MDPKVCIVGGEGNMGRRYSAVCNHLKIPVVIADRGTYWPSEYENVTHWIIATPTRVHAQSLVQVMLSSKTPTKILVEKPILDRPNFDQGVRAVEVAESFGHKVYMVNNYAYYSEGITESAGPTYYNFYNTGKDGIYADCIQLIHLAKSGVGYLKNESPIWLCMINGTELNRELIDLCYIKMIKDFVTDGKEYGRLWGIDDIKEAHRKVVEYEKSVNRNPSTEYFEPPTRQVLDVCG